MKSTSINAMIELIYALLVDRLQADNKYSLYQLICDNIVFLTFSVLVGNYCMFSVLSMAMLMLNYVIPKNLNIKC